VQTTFSPTASQRVGPSRIPLLGDNSDFSCISPSSLSRRWFSRGLFWQASGPASKSSTEAANPFLPDSSTSNEPPTRKQLITEFAGEPYEVARPIPVIFQYLDPEGVEARFEAANVAWVGESSTDALNGLKIELLNTLEGYEENEGRLGPEPHRQLGLLRTFIRRTSR
jgi:hypothetical protein